MTKIYQLQKFSIVFSQSEYKLNPKQQNQLVSIQLVCPIPMSTSFGFEHVFDVAIHQNNLFLVSFGTHKL